jgi:hypothetical protein
VYMQFIAPIGAGGGLDSAVPLVADITGNPLPLQPEIPAGVVVPASGSSLSATAAASSPTFPTVYPWIDYGALVQDGAFSETTSPDQMWHRNWFETPGSGEPPWANALADRPACCGGSLSLLDRAKQHPLIALALLVGVVLVVKRKP